MLEVREFYSFNVFGCFSTSLGEKYWGLKIFHSPSILRDQEKICESFSVFQPL